MFRITRDPSSGNSTECLAKITVNGSFLSVDMDVLGFMAECLLKLDQLGVPSCVYVRARVCVCVCVYCTL